MLPLNLVFFIDATKPSNYQSTIDSFRQALGTFGFSQFQNVFAHVKLSESNTGALPDIIDYLYDNDIRPLVTKSHAALFDETKYKDIYDTFNFDQLHASPYTIFVNGDAGISLKGGLFINHIAEALKILDQYKDVMTVDVLSLGVPASSFFNQISLSPFKITIARTRDLYLVAKLTLNNQNQFRGVSYGKAINNVFQTISQHPLRHLGFDPAAITLV